MTTNGAAPRGSWGVYRIGLVGLCKVELVAWHNTEYDAVADAQKRGAKSDCMFEARMIRHLNDYPVTFRQG